MCSVLQFIWGIERSEALDAHRIDFLFFDAGQTAGGQCDHHTPALATLCLCHLFYFEYKLPNYGRLCIAM